MSHTLLRVGQAAAELGVHPKTVRRWLKAGRLRYVRLPGGERRIPRRALDAVLSAQEEPLTIGRPGGGR
jgi:excisionase family DNA binding protein